jgi:hypothetical protein
MQKIENIINHIVLVLDASLSMTMVSDQLIKVADNQIKYLANRSKELDQETRITVYTFASQGGYYSTTPDIRCLVYDKDVLRMPSISSLYKANGNTPLIDATLLAFDDLAMTPEKYGEHSFLVYVLTDGEENASKNKPAALTQRIQNLPDNWTVATFVPNQTAVFEAKRFGFPKDNIAVWDTTDKGIQEVGEVMRQATENFMVSRSQGVRSIKNLFTMDAPSLSQIDAHMTPLHYGQFYMYDVHEVGRIDDFVQQNAKRPYKVGEAYYELSKTETIQPQKQVAILGKTGLYVGPDARKLLNLPPAHVKVAPNHNVDYKIFVQSTSVNRKLMPNTQLLIIP